MLKEKDFQTPPWVCDLMVSLVESPPKTVLEPTPGEGNLVNAISRRFPYARILRPRLFEELAVENVDQVISNPPFTPMTKGYDMLSRFFDFSGNVIVIMPWLALINSTRRTQQYLDHGLNEVIHLPRSVFRGSRVQTCILKFCDGFHGDITLSFAQKQIEVKSNI